MSMANLAMAAKHLPLVFARLDEQQRRWVAGLLSEVLGRGGTKQVAEFAGIDPKTVRQGRIDLDRELREYPQDGRGRGTALQKRSLTSSSN
ncbi:MAG: transposase [Planctomycetaceae bacterium]|nr:transposase [Planctomycetaceae bacterium]